jgi:hypothetical protein
VFENDAGQLFQPKALLVAIRDSPSLFVDLLRYPWKDDTGKSTTPDDDSTRVLAKKIRGLLSKLAELPGQSELCPMRDKTIAEWVTEVIQVASDHRYLTAVALQLADVIACGSWNAIDDWPTTEVAEAINVLAEAAPEIFPRHLAMSLSNVRGFHSVDPTGQSEKSLAEKLRRRADQLRQACPAAASALRDVANSRDSEAIRNIERANWER